MFSKHIKIWRSIEPFFKTLRGMNESMMLLKGSLFERVKYKRMFDVNESNEMLRLKYLIDLLFEYSLELFLIFLFSPPFCLQFNDKNRWFFHPRIPRLPTKSSASITKWFFFRQAKPRSYQRVLATTITDMTNPFTQIIQTSFQAPSQKRHQV